MGSRIHYRVTRAGYLFAAALVIVAAAAIASANNLLFLILASMLATAMISSVISSLCLAGLELELILPEHIAARQTVSARFKLRNLKWFPSFALHLSNREEPRVLGQTVVFSSLPARATAQADAPITFPRRGMHRQSLFVLATRFPFGLVERRAFISIRSEVVVYPALAASSSSQPVLDALRGELVREQRGMGSDFYRLRPYELYENARYVDWRSSARSGELQVREFAREERWTVSVYLDLRGQPSEEFEDAVESCAFLIWTLSEEAVRIHFRTQQAEFFFPDEVDVYRILRELALAEPDPLAQEPSTAEQPPDVLFSAAGFVSNTFAIREKQNAIVSKRPHL